jgi:hypothetical protein
MQQKVFPLNLNSQQGFFVNDNNQIIAAFSHYKKAIVIPVPYSALDIEVPENYKDYKVIVGVTDGFHLQMWTSKGYKEI